jgi:hypothetical protein
MAAQLVLESSQEVGSQTFMMHAPLPFPEIKLPYPPGSRLRSVALLFNYRPVNTTHNLIVANFPQENNT